MYRRLAAVDQHGNAARMRHPDDLLATGTMVPSAFDMCVMATIFVRGLSSFSNSSMRKLPSSSMGAHFRTAPLPLAVEMPRHDVGMMLHDREHDLVALADHHAAERRRQPD
jgi:hypothetical protein